MIKAVARGFSPRRAMDLLTDDYYLKIMDIREYVGKNPKSIIRMRGRLIGKNGKSRELIEGLGECLLSVYGHTVAIIARDDNLKKVAIAVDMIFPPRFLAHCPSLGQLPASAPSRA